MSAAGDLSESVGVTAACGALVVPRASYYRWRKPRTEEAKPRPSPARALSPQEREEVRDVLNSEEFHNDAPGEVYATLLDL